MNNGVGKILPQDSSIESFLFRCIYTGRSCHGKVLGKSTSIMWRCVSLFFWGDCGK